MTLSNLLVVLALMLIKPSVSLAAEGECVVKRSGSTPLHARNCMQEGNSTQVQACDTNVVCKANSKNVEDKDDACKDTPSAPKFTDAFRTGNKKEIAEYLRRQPSVLKIKVGRQSDEKRVASHLAKAGPDQRVVFLEFSDKRKTAMAMVERNPEIADALASGSLEYLYASGGVKSKDLMAYKIQGTKLVEIPTNDAIPSCGD